MFPPKRLSKDDQESFVKEKNCSMQNPYWLLESKLKVHKCLRIDQLRIVAIAVK